MSSLIRVRSYDRKKPGPTPEFVATTKALAGFVLSERELGEVLATELEEVLSQAQFDDVSVEQKQRMRESL